MPIPVIKVYSADKTVQTIDGDHPLAVTMTSGYGSVDPATGALIVTDAWRVSLQADETADDSDKTFTVPANTEWQILWIWVEYASTATVGNRQLEIQVQDSATDVIAQLARAGAVQAASLTRYYQFGPGLADLGAFRDTDYLTTPIPPTTILQAGDRLRIYDNNAIAAAADDMICQVKIASRTV